MIDMQRFIEIDRRNIARRTERALQALADSGETIRYDDEGMARIQGIIHTVATEYRALVSAAPSALLAFCLAAENKPYEGALPLRRILIRFKSPTGKG